jgi:hypothetical protein
MQALPINLDLECEICKNDEYSEHESGFYCCGVCGTMTQIRYGMGLDYADVYKSSIVIRRKMTIDDNPNDHEVTTVANTVGNTTKVNTCANSEFGSVSTRFSRGKGNEQKSKTFNEILMEHQKIFVNLFKSMCYYQHLKIENIKTNKNSDLTFHEFLKIFQNDDKYYNLYNIAKKKWKELVTKEYSIQNIRPTVKQNSRSRRATEDSNEFKKGSTHNLHNLHQTISDRRKRNSIREQLKSRKIKNYNIENISDIRDKNLKKSQKMNLFIEEYDQVKSHLNNYEEVIQREAGIPVCDMFTFKNIILIATNIFKINLEANSSYEEVIHQIFVNCGLNYFSTFKEGNFYDSEKSYLTPDNYLAIFHSILNSNVDDSSPINLGELSCIFKSFHMKNLYNYEIKFLKYLNKDKLFKLIDHSSDYSSVMKKIKHSSEVVLNLPQFFTNLAIKIYYMSEKEIHLQINHNQNIEVYLLSIIFFLIKVFYGLNELPYIYNIYKNKDRVTDKDLHKITDLFLKNAINDKLFEFYDKLPNLCDLLELMSKKIQEDLSGKILWEKVDLKKFLSIEYKENFFDYANNYLSSLDNGNKNNILSLEKKIQGTFQKFSEEKPAFASFTISEKVLNSRKAKQHLKETNRELHTFIKEEIEFYERFNKKKKESKKVDVPLPCETVVNFLKHAMKFESIKPNTSELIFSYMFTKLFKVDYQILRKCTKVIEKVTEQNYK